MNISSKYIVGFFGVMLLMSSCSDDFLQDKKLYGKYNYYTVYNNYETARNRVDNLYYQMLPGKKEGQGTGMSIVSTGTNDEFAIATDEYGGLATLLNPTIELDYNEINNGGKFTFDHFYVENKEISPWGYIRNINDCIEGLKEGELPEAQKNELLGQAYFMRAWRYFTMVKWYGGIPIIDRVQESYVSAIQKQGTSIVIPRKSTKECIEFICNDLQRAADLLPYKWENEAQDWGRVTKGTALAMKGRVLLLFASPLFNRSDEMARWEDAYAANKEALAALDQGGFGLAYENQPGATSESAANWGKMFLNAKGTDGNVNEAVFVTLYNNLAAQEDNSQFNNSWENSIRPRNAFAGGGMQPTMEIVDAFPMADGKKGNDSKYVYDSLCFFLNRDPRFYRTFTFPGEKWLFSGTPNSKLVDRSKPALETKFEDAGVSLWGDYPYDGDKYEFWGYTWYNTDEDMNNETKSGWAADMLGSHNASVLVRKRSDDLQINAAPLYSYTYTKSNAGFAQSAAPFMEMRYAEVLLNYAEAAAATNRTGEAYEALRRIRSRVYNPNDGVCDDTYGLDNTGDRAKMLAQVLDERKYELAFEGKRFDDMRRWMLFDGGVGQESLRSSWAVTGFGGNTCTYLGVKPVNGHRDHYIEITCNDLASVADSHAADPILKDNCDPHCSPLDPCDRLNTENRLCNYYRAYMHRKNRNSETTLDAEIPFFQPYYYFVGLCYSAMYNNPTLYQTIGWEDFSHSGPGIYDPLETDPDKIPVDNDINIEFE
ncbi:MAG: RagB/SusD family nutrient uptake outer membrane protein [Bacteroidales bacterium]|nr:RagB/SusD family nutrient uptake outer membrane protein [Bacteroidales bacterium]